MKCKDCKYWTHYKGKENEGQCRRYSPEVVADVSGGGIATAFGIGTTMKTQWPETAWDDWCGEHEPRQAPEAKAS